MTEDLITMDEIICRAWNNTLFLIEKEEEHMHQCPDNEITINNLLRLYNEEKQIHDMMTMQERKKKKQ